jgi:hypothetical protein
MTNKKDKIINLKNKRNNDDSTLGNLLPQIFTLFAKNLKPKLITCFESLDDSFFDLAEKAESNQKQTLYFESMRLVRKSRERMFIEFFESIKSTFRMFKKNEFDFFNQERSYDQKTKALSLSLIDEKELDETLAKSNLINKSDMAYHRHIHAMTKRFSLLASGTELKDNQIPIGPYVIVNSFTLCIKKLDLEVTLKLIMYKLFERNVMGQLNDTYMQINDFLAEKGIIPEIKYNIGRAGSQVNFNNTDMQAQNKLETENPEQPVEGDIEQNPNVENHQAAAANQAQNQNMGPALNHPINQGISQQYVDPNYQLISQLFKHSHQNYDGSGNIEGTPANTTGNLPNTGATSNMNAGPPAANIDMGSMLNALSILQGDLFNKIKKEEHTNKSPTEIKEDLIKQLHKLDSETKDKKVRQKDEDTIDLVGMLFQFIVDDRNLPDAIQVLLAKLQIPYLKIALQDRNLFADKSHPARVLLDRLSLASVGWNEESDKKLQFHNKIESITHQILELDEYSFEIFEDIQNDFNKFIAKLKKKSDVAQKRTKEKSFGQDKINQAKEESAKLLVEKMTNKQMPILIRDILLGEWSNVLILMYLRHSTDSNQYLEKVYFVDKIIQYSQETIGNSKNEVSTDDIKQVSKVYAKGLKLVAFNSKELIDKQHSLVKCLTGIHQLDTNNTPIDAKEIDLIPPEEILKLSEIRKQKHEIVNYIEEIIEPSNEKEQFDDIKDDNADIIANLKTGTWLEFSREGNTAVRAKLSWISPITGKYLFVNSRGLKITDKTDLALAAGLRDKTIRVLQQVALFDRALSAIASKLKKEEPASEAKKAEAPTEVKKAEAPTEEKNTEDD